MVYKYFRYKHKKVENALKFISLMVFWVVVPFSLVFLLQMFTRRKGWLYNKSNWRYTWLFLILHSAMNLCIKYPCALMQLILMDTKLGITGHTIKVETPENLDNLKVQQKIHSNSRAWRCNCKAALEMARVTWKVLLYTRLASPKLQATTVLSRKHHNWEQPLRGTKWKYWIYMILHFDFI